VIFRSDFRIIFGRWQLDANVNMAFLEFGINCALVGFYQLFDYGKPDPGTAMLSGSEFFATIKPLEICGRSLAVRPSTAFR